MTPLEPDDKNQIEEELKEKDFIQPTPKVGWSWWLAWVLLFAAIVAVFWGSGSWFYETMETQVEESPFLQVTNRQLSVFLWKFPQYMPQHVKNKTGYLPGFEYTNRVGIKKGEADAYCMAPPEVLYMYHTWSRLLSDEFIARPIPRMEFLDFLNYNPEWKPENWPEAPEKYRRFLVTLAFSKIADLAKEPEATVPMVVRQAFQGWKNYRLEGELINIVKIDYATIDAFLEKYPHYRRNYWRNILLPTYPNYLLSYTLGDYDKKEVPVEGQMAPFLRVAVFNFMQAKKGM